MKMIHRGEKGLTLIELLIVVAILGIIAAVIIPNIGTFMTMGTVSAANSEAENVKTASLAYYADVGIWPVHTGSVSGNYSFTDYYAGSLRASYHFDGDGFLDGVGDPPPTVPTDAGTTSSEYNGIEWADAPSTGHGQWIRS